MEITLHFNSLIHLAAAILGILSGFIILYFGIKTNPANQPLAFAQIFASLAIFVDFIVISKLIFYWPFVYRLGHLFILIFIPMPFLYVLFYTKKRLWRWFDLLHALPLVVFLVDYGHVYLLSNAEKMTILQEEIYNLPLLGEFRQSKYIGPGFHEDFRSYLFSFYWVVQFFIFMEWVLINKNPDPGARLWRNWTIFFIVCQFFMFVPFYLNLLGFQISAADLITKSFVILWILLSSVSLFFYPSLLYGFTIKPEKEIPKATKTIETSVEEGQKLEEILKSIEHHMDERKLFLTQGYSINDFSKDINLPVYQISKCLNIFRGMGFVDYNNQKRIMHCVSKFGKREWQIYTFEAMASECGFSNRNTFTRAFKKFQGCYPSEYKKNLNF
ncbi:AraC family transcriptional regulator [Cyclobacteriaceae bacterium YHN15]|nr:AraC family transcriptional regulator [Cyclobacteriaceae bacterium YHN15]